MAREAKKKRKYSRGSQNEVKNEMRRYKRGTAKSGRGGKGGKVKSRKQAIAIGLSKARKKGKKVPKLKSVSTVCIDKLMSHCAGRNTISGDCCRGRDVRWLMSRS